MDLGIIPVVHALLFIFINNALIIMVNGAEYDFTVRVDGGVIDCYFQNVSSSLYATLEIDYQIVMGVSPPVVTYYILVFILLTTSLCFPNTKLK
uniref:Uncharacterized protein n=1 Tax=Romanomermis culicivorax TaxID=13658 RepID=A0A915IMT8_ROMCU